LVYIIMFWKRISIVVVQIVNVTETVCELWVER
jgi:hypothetical protein